MSATPRESSVIVGAAIGAVFFKERFEAPRIAAAGLVVVGIGLTLHAARRVPGAGCRVAEGPKRGEHR